MKISRFASMPSNLQRHPFYVAWQSMKRRCDNPMIREAASYSQKGITYIDSWRDFKGFYKDMFDSWVLGSILDRIDNNKGYSKENCRWTTGTESRRNRLYVRLDMQKAQLIRDKYSTGKYTQCKLAKEFQISRGTIQDVVSGKTWR